MGAALQPSFEALGTPLVDVTFVALDVETTGLSPTEDRITEIAAVKVRGGEVLGELATLVHPGRPIPPRITALTGISDALVADAPPLRVVLPSLLEFLTGAVLVAHNARFDTGFLDAELRRAGYPPLDVPVVDTARLARRALRDEVRDVRLATLAQHLRCRRQPNHRALADARATVDVLHALLERVGSLGIVTLEDLRSYLRAGSDPLYRHLRVVREAPARPGVYRFLAPDGEVLYVGRSNDLRDRLRSYLGQDRRRHIVDLVRATARVEWEVTPTTLEAAVRELRLIHAHRPRYNRRHRRPVRPVYVTLTAEPFPRPVVTTCPARSGPVLGPLRSRRHAEAVVEALVDASGLRPCRLRLRRRQDHPACVLAALGRCAAPCDGSQPLDAYAAEVARVVEAVAGDPSPLFHALRARMADLARRDMFELAAEVRGRLEALATALLDTRAHTALSGVADLVAARPARHGGWELVRIRRGALVCSAAVAELPDAATAAGLLRIRERPTPEQPTSEDPTPEELRLVARWLDRPGTRVLWCEGSYALPAAGGAVLERTRRELRAAARQVTRDLAVVRGVKVMRRVS